VIQGDEAKEILVSALSPVALGNGFFTDDYVTY